MRLVKADLSFTDIDGSRSLYDDDNLMEHWCVDARYYCRRSYAHDPDVCAIPPMPDIQRLLQFFSISADISPWFEIDEITNSEKYENIANLNKVMVPLGLHLDVAKALHQVLLSSYTGRQVVLTDTTWGTPAAESGLSGSVVSLRRQDAPRPEGFYIHGNSGMGKSVALGLSRGMYPRAIRHTVGDYSYTQIPIIFVTALCNQVSDVFRSIAAQIDEILDTGNTHEEKVVNKSLTKAQGYIKTWIKLYHIGCIIIDEIQFLKSSSSSKGLEDLIGITAETGAGFGIVGNNDSLDAVVKNPRILGRVERNIVNVDIRTTNSGVLFNRAIGTLWNYQWTETVTPLSEDIQKYLQDASYGNIALLKAMLARIQICAIKKNDKELLTVDKIRDYVGDMATCMKDLLAEHTAEGDRRFTEGVNGVYDEAREEDRKQREESISAYIEDLQRKDREKIIAFKKKEVAKAVSITKAVTFDQAMIAVEAAAEGWPGLLDMPDAELARKAGEILDSKRPKKREQTKRRRTTTARPGDARKIDVAAKELLESSGVLR